jgi:hypothetical protein
MVLPSPAVTQVPGPLKMKGDIESFIHLDATLLRDVARRSLRFKWPAYPEGIEFSRTALSQNRFGASSCALISLKDTRQVDTRKHRLGIQ